AFAAGQQVLGRPVRGGGVYVRDARGEPAIDGAVGELWIAGAGLARGYVGAAADDPAAAARFRPAPWDPALRLYRTGDRGWRRADGRVVFVGRVDGQRKVRGYRVEPGESEMALRADPAVREAVALVVGGGDDDEATLMAFVLPRGDELDVAALRARLAGSLPAYLIPTRYELVSRFPTTANGKIDRAALAAVAISAPIRRATGGAIVGATERLVRDIWQRVLAREDLGPHDDFFALGGHSVKAILVLSQLAKARGVKLSLRAFFAHPTLRALARRVDQAARGDAAVHDGVAGAIRLRDDGPEASTVFFLPPLTGTSTVYRELVEQLDVPMRAWGLQAPGFDADDAQGALPADLDAMAAIFVARLRRLQPAGPVRLCGYSMGVPLALQVAARVEAAGDRASLVLLDGSLDGAAYHADGVAIDDLDALRGRRYWGKLLALFDAHLDAAARDHLQRLVAHHLRLLRDHRSAARADRALRADLVCIEAADAAPRAGMDALARCTSGRLAHRLTPGDHYAMFHPPHRSALLHHLRDALRWLTAADADRAWADLAIVPPSKPFTSIESVRIEPTAAVAVGAGAHACTTT
ncbi:MAG: thioesterase domain-containing protein, partial [Acidobacteriota bacterium]